LHPQECPLAREEKMYLQAFLLEKLQEHHNRLRIA